MNRRLLSIVAFAALAAPSSALATHQEGEAPHGITTQGAAVISAKHDLARFSFGATFRRSTPSAAQRAASGAITRVITAVRRQGVAPEDVRTGSIRLFRVTRRVRGGRTRFLGFRASQSIRVTVRDLPASSRVVDAAVKAGATSVSGPDFGISNRAVVYREALRLALRDAREKARALAEEAGLTLGRVSRVVEGGDAEPSFANSLDAGAGGSGGDEEVRAVPTPVRPGTEQISALVLVTFETS